MDVKGANPFLFTDDDYVSPSTGNSNPFLLNDEDLMGGSGGDNPFLSQTATTISSNSTNPFAFDPMDLGPMEANPAEVNTYQTQYNDSNVFGTNEGNTNVYNQQEILMRNDATVPSVGPQKPTELDLKYSNNVQQNSNNVQAQNQSEGSKVPPPRPPPSKETQDLLMSVMGAMDATSSHLLDRIPLTRSPSPVSMRDLHSPSPTPEPQTQDLLDVSDSTPVAQVNPTPITQERRTSHAEELFMNLGQQNDVNHNSAVQQQNILPLQNVAPVRPPRPQPPKKPPPPAFAQTMILNQNITMNDNRPPPPKPPPPSVNRTQTNLENKNVSQPIPAHINVQAEQPPKPKDDIMDMFGMDEPTPVQKPVATKADILNLYNAPKQEQKVSDLLFDNFDSDIPSEAATTEPKQIDEQQNQGFGTSPNLSDSSPAQVGTIESNAGSMVTTPIVQDNIISPEPSQADLQMDTSDSQSKGSVSSVTFNPFAGNEDNLATSPSKPNITFDTNMSTQEPSMLLEDSNSFIQEQNAYNQEQNAFNQEQNAFNQEQNAYNQEKNTYNQEQSIFGQEPIISSVNTSSILNDTYSQPSAFQQDTAYQKQTDIFGTTPQPIIGNILGDNKPIIKENDEFDAFAAKFESAAKDEQKNDAFDAFSGGNDAWGNDTPGFNDGAAGFGADDSFDAFLALQEPPAVPQSTPNRVTKGGSQDSDEGKDFNVFIR